MLQSAAVHAQKPSLLLSDVRIPTSAHSREQASDEAFDILVSDGKIQRIAAHGEIPRSDLPEPFEIIDGQGSMLLPSLVELDSQLGGFDYAYRETIDTALSAAAAGGFAIVCQNASSEIPLDRLSCLDHQRANLRRSYPCTGKGPAEWHPIAAASLGLQGKEMSSFHELKQGGAIAFCLGGSGKTDSASLRRLFSYGLDFSLPFVVRPAETSLQSGTTAHEGSAAVLAGHRGEPGFAEAIEIARLSILAAAVPGTKLHISSISSIEGLEAFKAARQSATSAESKQRLSAAVCFLNLLHNDESCSGYDSLFRLQPPLRSEQDRLALVKACEAGDVQAITASHRPLSALEKDGEFDHALPGQSTLQVAFSATYELVRRGELSLASLMKLFVDGPAQILGISPPRLEIGAPARFFLFDAEGPALSGTDWKSRSTNSSFLDSGLRGTVKLTVFDGKIVHRLN